MIPGLPSLIRGEKPEVAAALKAPEVHSGSYSIPAANVFSFGMVVIQVRPTCLAAYSVGGGEIGDLSSAQGFHRRTSVQPVHSPGYYIKDQGWYTTGSSTRDTKVRTNRLVVGDDSPLFAPRPHSATRYEGSGRVSTYNAGIFSLHGSSPP